MNGFPAVRLLGLLGLALPLARGVDPRRAVEFEQDNSMILFGSSLHDGNKHEHRNLPLVLAGRSQGTVRPGRRLTAAPETPLHNLHLALLHRDGIVLPSFGESTGALPGLV